MTTLEDRLREALHDAADQMHPAPMLPRLDAAREHSAGRRLAQPRLVVAATAVLVVLAIVGGMLLVRRADRASVVDPVVRPPKQLQLSPRESARPGRADLAVMVAMVTGEGPRAFVWGEGQSGAVALPESAGQSWGAAWSQQLSLDGTRLVRQRVVDNGLEIVNLRSGRIDKLGGRIGYCPALSPDNGSVAFVQPRGRQAVVLDLGSDRLRVLGDTAHKVVTDEPDCTDNTFAWAPDGQRVVVQIGSDATVVDLQGNAYRVFRGAHVANASMSWSPDGRQLLLYQPVAGRYVTATIDGPTAVLRRPVADAVRPLGWAGTDVVWLAGPPESARLLTASPAGTRPRLWTEIQLGGRSLRTVVWSTRLAGRAG